MVNHSAEIMERGMNCLLEQLGVAETEKFISILIRERFDYTKWRRTYFGDASVQEINKEAASCARKHPFVPKRQQAEI